MTYVANAIAAAEPRPAARSGRLERLRAVYFATPGTSTLTLVLSALLALLGWQLVTWGIVDAIFDTRGQGPNACRVAGAGACWAVVGEKLRLILFGVYPYAQQWRPAVAMVFMVGMYLLSTRRSWWNRRLVLAWAVALIGVAVFMRGGVAGLPLVTEDQWGGLPVTLILATLGLAAGFPVAVLLALLRHSPEPGVGKTLAVTYIEFARSVPLLVVLFFASVMIPLFLPQDMSISKLLRVFLAFALFAAAYLAEVIRGGLQAVPRGQYEAADALGLSRRVTITRVVLPQAIAAVLPALVNVFIAFFKATSIVVVVGIFDIMTAARRAVADPLWQGFGTEIYLCVAAIYFVFCHAMSRYSAHLHKGMDTHRRR